MHKITLAQEQQKKQTTTLTISAYHGSADPQNLLLKAERGKLAAVQQALCTAPQCLPLSWGHRETFWQAKMSHRYFGRGPWHRELRRRVAEAGQRRREASRAQDIVFYSPLQTHMGSAALDKARELWALWIDTPSSEFREGPHQAGLNWRLDTLYTDSILVEHKDNSRWVYT